MQLLFLIEVRFLLVLLFFVIFPLFLVSLLLFLVCKFLVAIILFFLWFVLFFSKHKYPLCILFSNDGAKLKSRSSFFEIVGFGSSLTWRPGSSNVFCFSKYLGVGNKICLFLCFFELLSRFKQSCWFGLLIGLVELVFFFICGFLLIFIWLV